MLRCMWHFVFTVLDSELLMRYSHLEVFYYISVLSFHDISSSSSLGSIKLPLKRAIRAFLMHSLTNSLCSSFQYTITLQENPACSLIHHHGCSLVHFLYFCSNVILLEGRAKANFVNFVVRLGDSSFKTHV